MNLWGAEPDKNFIQLVQRQLKLLQNSTNLTDCEFEQFTEMAELGPGCVCVHSHGATLPFSIYFDPARWTQVSETPARIWNIDGFTFKQLEGINPAVKNFIDALNVAIQLLRPVAIYWHNQMIPLKVQ